MSLFSIPFGAFHQMLWLFARGFDDWYLNCELMGVPPPCLSRHAVRAMAALEFVHFYFSPKINPVIPGERSETRDPSCKRHNGSRLCAMLTHRLAGMTILGAVRELEGMYGGIVTVSS
jgi:hypothetical protein